MFRLLKKSCTGQLKHRTELAHHQIVRWSGPATHCKPLFSCRAAVLRGSLTCSCDNISVPPFASDHREWGAQHKYGVTICNKSTQRLTSRAILASTRSLCSFFFHARTVSREVWGPTPLRSTAAMLPVWQTRKKLQLCSVLSESEIWAHRQAGLHPYQGLGINSPDSC